MLTTSLNAEFEKPNVLLVHFVQIVLPAYGDVPSYTINLNDGQGTFTWLVDGVPTTFSGYDPAYGTLAAISDISEAIAAEAGDMQVTLAPPSDAGFADLNNPYYQGGQVRVWVGAINPVTGLVVPDPVELWFGMYDTAKGNVDGTTNVRTVEINVVSDWTRFMTADEGQRLNDPWHQSIWPGENALKCNVQALTNPYWGQSTPSTPTSSPQLATIPTGNDYMSGVNSF